MKIVGILQARTGSTRLPQKVMLPILGKEMICHVIERTLRAKMLDDVVIATTTLPQDDTLEDLCKKYGYKCFRHIGANTQDLTSLYYACALKYNVDFIVRLTGDNPLIEPSIIDLVVEKFLAKYPAVDYMNTGGWNDEPFTFPVGISVEICPTKLIQEIWVNDTHPEWREHATLPIRQDRSGKYKIEYVTLDKNYSHMRWTVDTPEDYTNVCRIFNHFGHNRFTMQEGIDFCGGM